MNQIHFVIFVLLIGLFPTVPVGFQSLHGMGELRKDPACYPPVVRCRQAVHIVSLVFRKNAGKFQSTPLLRGQHAKFVSQLPQVQEIAQISRHVDTTKSPKYGCFPGFLISTYLPEDIFQETSEGRSDATRVLMVPRSFFLTFRGRLARNETGDGLSFSKL